MGGGVKTEYSTEDKSTTNNYDPEYNARMASIAEQQQANANELYKFYQDKYQPYEEQQLAANTRLVNSNANLTEATENADLALLPQRQAVQSQALTQQSADIASAAPATAKFYDQATNGITADYDGAIGRAIGDVNNQYANAEDLVRRQAASMGLDPNSGKFASLGTRTALDRARAAAGAASGAYNAERDRVENTNFGRLATAAGVAKGIGTSATPYSGGSGVAGSGTISNPDSEALGWSNASSSSAKTLAQQLQGTQSESNRLAVSAWAGVGGGD